MSDNDAQVRFIGYEVLKFQFEQIGSGEKEGWNFYPEVQVVPLGNSILRGEVILSVNAFCVVTKEKPCSVSVLLRGFFEGKNMAQETFKQYCLVKGSAYLVPTLRMLVADFLTRARSLPDNAL